MMDRFEHGGNIYAHEGVLDYSANLNPLGMPDSVKQALAQSLDSLSVYPDPHSHALIRAIAQFEGVDDAWVLPTAGATDAITRVCLAVKPTHGLHGLVCAPSYSGYEQALEQAGAQISRHTLREEENFQVTTRILDDIDHGIDLIFLANPNNPTGALIDRDVLIGVLDAAQRCDALVVLDECFIDLTPQAGSNTLLASYDNLLIVKTFTKTFALAGVRAGYALCSHANLLGRMNAFGQPWAVSTPAQVAGIAALQERDYIELAKKLVAHERKRLVDALQNWGMQVVPGCANYIMFKDPEDRVSPSGKTAEPSPDGTTEPSPGGTAEPSPSEAAEPSPLYDALLERGILIRRCANFHGLVGSWYRIAVRAPEENTRFLVVLQEVFA